ncbi:MAG: septum formation initiator family protein [bacterium]
MNKEKKFFKRIFSSKLFLLAVFIILALLLLSLGKNFIKRYQVNREIARLEAEIVKLESNNQELGDLIDYLNTDFFVEQEARLKLGLSKEGEKVVIIPSDKAAAQLDVLPEKEYNGKALTNPGKWWQYFFGQSS